MLIYSLGIIRRTANDPFIEERKRESIILQNVNDIKDKGREMIPC